MDSRDFKFELPKHIERYLAALSKLYANDGMRLLQEIIVNAQIRIAEEWSQDNRGASGHALYLVIPEALFLSAIKDKDNIQNQITTHLNRIHNVPGEYIAEVFIEMDVAEDGDWRRDSGLLTVGQRVVLPDAQKRIWKEGQYRIFLSHKSEVKKETADLKEYLEFFGISAFVAHSDIHPTRAWQDEIESALATMDCFVALMTEQFHESDWTDQEVGYAVARGVRMMAVRLGRDPYGFIAKFQGISATWSNCAEEIVKVAINDTRMFSSYLGALRTCASWDSGNVLAKALAGLTALSSEQADQLVSTYNETQELWGSWGFNGGRPYQYGPGLVTYLNRLTGFEFRKTEEGTVERVG